MSKFHAIYGKGKGGDTYGEVQTLLWENTSPKTEFPAQTVNIDLHNYDGVIIEFYDKSTAASQTVVSIIKLPKGIEHAYGCGYKGVSEQAAAARNVSSITDTGVTFENSWSSSSSSYLLIPYRIYGYKQYEPGSLSTDANEIVVEVNTDKQLDIKSYYMILGVSMTTELSLSKGTLIGSIKQSHAGGIDVSAIVYTGDDGIINSTGNSLHIKKIEVG